MQIYGVFLIYMHLKMNIFSLVRQINPIYTFSLYSVPQKSTATPLVVRKKAMQLVSRNEKINKKRGSFPYF